MSPSVANTLPQPLTVGFPQSMSLQLPLLWCAQGTRRNFALECCHFRQQVLETAHTGCKVVPCPGGSSVLFCLKCHVFS